MILFGKDLSVEQVCGIVDCINLAYEKGTPEPEDCKNCLMRSAATTLAKEVRNQIKANARQKTRFLHGARQIRRDDFYLCDDSADWQDNSEVWNYSLSANCNVDEVFGTNVETFDNNDYLNLYVDVSPDYGAIESNIYVTLCKEDGTDEYFERVLSSEEKTILLELIQAFEIKRLLRLLAEKDNDNKNLEENKNV